ncbi:MAG: hypothetical protein A2Z09_03725 [Nitrospirae bacterium RBG_16_43_8]|nr:MAG: hypothetical protein A2Z09_03725 [Nitrospirae bacterium RBG_16_43_8]
MDTKDYASMLLDSSFKEANLFWMRNTAFSLFQSIFIGFTVNAVINKTPTSNSQLTIVVCIVGILISIVHYLILHLSKKLNMVWFDSLKLWVSERKTSSLNIKSENDDYHIWNHFENHLKEHGSIHLKKINIFLLVKMIPIIFLLFWIVLLILKGR